MVAIRRDPTSPNGRLFKRRMSYQPNGRWGVLVKPERYTMMDDTSFQGHKLAWDIARSKNTKRMKEIRAKFVKRVSGADVESDKGLKDFLRGMFKILTAELQLIREQLKLSPACLETGVAELEKLRDSDERATLEFALEEVKASHKSLIRQKNQKLSAMRKIDRARQAADQVAQQRAERDQLQVALADAEEQLEGAQRDSTKALNVCTDFLSKLLVAGFEV